MASPDYQAVQREMAPRLAAFQDQITQNEALFKRVEAVYNSPAKAKLNAEQQRLTWLYYTNFVRAGARLNADAKKRLSQINQTARRSVHEVQPERACRRNRSISGFEE